MNGCDACHGMPCRCQVQLSSDQWRYLSLSLSLCLSSHTFFTLPGHNMPGRWKQKYNSSLIIHRVDNMLVLSWLLFWSFVTVSLLVRILLKIICPPADINNPGVLQSPPLYFPLCDREQGSVPENFDDPGLHSTASIMSCWDGWQRV